MESNMGMAWRLILDIILNLLVILVAATKMDISLFKKITRIIMVYFSTAYITDMEN
jgi:hypothetical protein